MGKPMLMDPSTAGHPLADGCAWSCRRTLEDHHLHQPSAAHGHDRNHGAGRAHDGGLIPRLRTAGARSYAAARAT